MVRKLLMACALAACFGCAHSTASAEFDAEGRITRCDVVVYELARVVETECSEDAAKAHHQRESGWAGQALSALGGWLAGKVGL